MKHQSREKYYLGLADHLRAHLPARLHHLRHLPFLGLLAFLLADYLHVGAVYLLAFLHL